ncbi:MAG TPA: hypothetical protein VIL74_02035 [Pyrinomonadaceae bacterium]|jgi:hypothetical protein
MMQKKLVFKHLSGFAAGKILTVIFAMLFFGAVCFGQETESAARLNMTGTSLPAGAQRVLPQYVPAEIDGALEKLVSAGEGKLRRGDSETLIWTGNDLKKSGANAIVNRLTETFKAAGWKYEVGGTENGVTLFSLLKDGAVPRALVGLYGEADGTLLFALTELHAADGRQTDSNPTNANQTSSGEGGNVGEYVFTTPAGWSRSDAAGRIVLSSEIGSKIEFLPLTNSSGNLESDADRILWQYFKGYDSWYANGFEADYGTFEKGKTAQGLEYYRAYRYAKKIGDENNGMAQSKFDAVILLVRLGGKIAVIAGSQPFQTGDYVKGSALNALDLILYDLKFKSAPDAYNLKNDLLGSWSTASGSVALAYTFNANGTFNKGGAMQFRTSRDAYTDNVTTTSYGMTDSYSLAGNILTQNYKQTKESVKYKIRVYDTKYDKDAWQHKIGFLPLANPDGGTIVMRRSN